VSWNNVQNSNRVGPKACEIRSILLSMSVYLPLSASAAILWFRHRFCVCRPERRGEIDPCTFFSVKLGSLWKHFRGSRWCHVMVTLDSLWGHVRITLGSLWNHFEITLGSLQYHFGSLWGHFGITLASGENHFGITLESLWDHVGVHLWPLWCHLWAALKQPFRSL
jgi:hypothetical protein